MKWKALTVSLAALALVALAIAGCGQSSTPITTAPTSVNAPAATTPSLGGAPPSMARGGVSDNRTPPSMDLSTAARTLGVTESQLQNALGYSSQPPVDLAAAAKVLGVSEEALQQALGFPGGAPPSIGAQPTRTQ